MPNSTSRVERSQSTVSVIIPCYNADRWLEETLRSLESQTEPPLEILVVDDGSTDGSCAIALRHPTVTLLRGEHRGQSAAANAGLRQARGRFVKFLDADDLLNEQALEVQARALEQYPGYVAAADWARFSSAPEEARFLQTRGPGPMSAAGWLARELEHGQPMMQCARFLIEREALQRIGGWNPDLSLINDFEFFTRVISSSGGVVDTPEARLFYRSGIQGSLSDRKSRDAWLSASKSIRMGIGHVLGMEASERTRSGCQRCLADVIHQMWPFEPDIARELEQHAQSRGFDLPAPRGSASFMFLSNLFGWKFARNMQHRYRLLQSWKVTGNHRARGSTRSEPNGVHE